MTDTEIEEAVNNTLKLLENAKNNTANDDYYNNFVDLISGMGYTMEQYKTDLLPKATEYMLKSNKYYEYQKEQIVMRNPNLKADEIKKEYEDYLDKLVKAADVKLK